MSKTHAMDSPSIFGNEPARPVLEIVVDETDELASKAVAEYGAKNWTSDWRDVVIDPGIDVIDIATPNKRYKEMVFTSLKARKHVSCEKLLERTADETSEVLIPAREASAIALIGHNYPHNPIHSIARDIIRGGEIGELVNVRMGFNVDFLANAAISFIWHYDSEETGGSTMGNTKMGIQLYESDRGA